MKVTPLVRKEGAFLSIPQIPTLRNLTLPDDFSFLVVIYIIYLETLVLIPLASLPSRRLWWEHMVGVTLFSVAVSSHCMVGN